MGIDSGSKGSSTPLRAPRCRIRALNPVDGIVADGLKSGDNGGGGGSMTYSTLAGQGRSPSRGTRSDMPATTRAAEIGHG